MPVDEEFRSANFDSVIVDAGIEFQEADDAGRAIAILNLGRLYERVRSSLDLDPFDYRRGVGVSA